MPTCFIIQPFDGGPYDKRYEDVFVPAVKAAGLDPYRVDRDPAASIPIDEIENGIKRADACLADISEPNPNVWFELGFAIAAGKPVVMVCTHKPDRKFPFDVQHRAIISYRTESARDFEELEKKITARLNAELAKEDKLVKFAQASVVADVAGLNPLEFVALATVAQNVDGPEDLVDAYQVRNDMEKAGYNRLAASLGLTSLTKKRMLHTERHEDQNGERYTVYGVAEKGYDWLFANQSRLALKTNEPEPPMDPITDDDIPF